MNTILKRVISLMLCFILTVGCMPVSAFATESGETVTTEPTDVTTAQVDAVSDETEAPSESTEAVAPLSEEIEPSSEATEPSSEATEPSSEATEPSSEATEPSSEATESSTEATESAEDTTEPTEKPKKVVTRKKTSASKETATDDEKKSAEIAVNGITLDQTELKVCEGDEPVTLTATVLPEDATNKTITWTTSDAEVVSVADGVLTFGKMGTATVTAAAGEFSVNCTVTVSEAEITAYAEDDGITQIIAASDFQQNDGHEKSDEVMEGIIAAVVNAGYVDIDGALFCGDYSNSYTATESNKGLGYVYGNYNETWGLGYDEIVFVQGNHDPASTSNLDQSGANDPESGDYGVFVIHEDDYGWASGDYGKKESEIKATAANLKSYLDQKLADKFDEPIFVISHLPLHYSMRTYRDGDCRYAQYIFDVLNEAAESGLNIFFLYGHNHSQSFENYHGGGAVFYSAGDEILIGDTSNQKTHHTETIQFTYLNAGYTGRFDAEDTADPTNTATVFTINDNNVVIERYDANGLHKLKSAGIQSKAYESTEKNLYAPNTRVENSPQTITLKKFSTEQPDVPEQPQIVELTDEASGTTVKAPGLTALTVTKTSKNEEGYLAYVTYDITPAGYTEGNEAEVIIALDMTLFDAARPVVVIDKKLNTRQTKTIVDGTVTFTTNHFSEYDVAQVDTSNLPSDWVQIPGTTTYNYTLANSISGDQKYVIVGNDHDVALQGTTSMGAQSVAINGTTMTSDIELTEWTFSGSNGGTIYNGTRYLRYNDGAFSLSTSSTDLIFTDNGSNFRIWRDGSKNDYSFYYDGSSWTRNNDAKYVRLFTAGEPTTTTACYAGMTGQTDYTLITGQYADQAAVIDEIKKNIAVYTAEDQNGTNAETTENYTIEGTVTPDKAGKYTLNVTYGGKTLGTIKIEVTDKIAASVVVSPMSGEVERGSGNASLTGSTMTVTYDNGDTETIDITVGMLTGTYNLRKNGSYSGLTISYAGQKVSGYTLNVVDVAGDNFPAYPNGGSVQVTKTGEGQDFQNTGLVRVELSTSGMPTKKGADVIVMLDTSSSMTSNDVDDKSQKRSEALQSSLQNLIGQLQANGPDGKPMDIKIAIADFNGYYVSNSNTNRAYNLETIDHLKGTTVKSSSDNFKAKVYTGNNAGDAGSRNLNASAFVPVGSLNAKTVADSITFESGTNYDYAFDAIYQLGSAIRAQNKANNVERDLFVIFMSDGGPFQYNYFSTQSEASSGGARWNNWMTGNVVDDDWDDKTHAYFYHPQGKHWMAEAVKGDPDAKYTVIRKNATNFIDVTGDGVADRYMTELDGLGAKMYSIGFCAEKDDNAIKAASIRYVLQNIASDLSMYHTANTGADLNGIFTEITGQIRYAAQNARFVDQMGSHFDLQMNPTVKSNANGGGDVKVDTSITVTSQNVYTKDTTTNTNDIGKAYGTPEELEKVSFTVDQAGNITATSTKKTGNILNNGVIEADTFFYNTTSEIKTINLKSGGTYQLPGETFYWNIGTINEKRFTLSYMVYLTGSMTGDAPPADSYDTNNFADLTYENYLGNEVTQSVPSPAMPWGGANVSYAFYLVDADGNPLLQDGTRAENFLTSYKVTQPVVYDTINLNAGATILSAIGKDVLPKGYVLFDENAAYTVTIQSGDGDSNWNITSTTAVQSTYVMGYAGAQEYSNAAQVSENSYDYTHTTVYFAVKWNVGTVPDAVVIDYGLPVNISVLANDMFGGNGTLAGVGLAANMPASYTSQMNGNFTASINKASGTAYGTASVNGDKVKYVLDGMTMDKPEKLAYAVNYTGTINPGYYYGEVTVIPATTIYFEDDFLTFAKYDTKGDYDNTNDTLIANSWGVEGVTAAGATQAEDRPGEFSLSNVDANNIYGFDAVNNSMSTHSLGSAAKVHVDANSYATASFTFYGTGFDVISMTSDTTGTIVVDIYQNNELIRSDMVDTFYGMTEGGALSPNNPAALYQVPVIKFFDLPYGQYSVVITATYAKFLDHAEAGGYDLYLDAIRIYDPTGNEDETANNAYKEDGEAYPIYEELRNKIIAASEYDVTENADGTVTVTGKDLPGAIFIDCNNGVTSIKDYVSYGPNNEVYLASGQAIAFAVDAKATMADVQLGIKVANGGSVTYTINNDQKTVDTTTDMYYSIWDYVKDGKVVTIKNVSGGILSLTNIKATFDDEIAPYDMLKMTSRNVGNALMMLKAPVVEEEVPETTVPEESKPQESVPETTVPEETEPEETEPETSIPEVTEPKEDLTEEIIVKKVVETVKNFVKKLFSKFFR